MISRLFTILYILFYFLNLNCQIAPGKYWVEFKDKNNNTFNISQPQEFLSQRAIDRRTKYKIPIVENDLPITKQYHDSLIKLGCKIIHQSKWLNGVTVFIQDSSLIDTILQLGFVKKISLSYHQKSLITTNDSLALKCIGSLTPLNYGQATKQIELEKGQCLHQMGYRGEGIQIAIFDAGFNHADTLPAFDSVFNNNQVLGTRNFVSPGTNVYNGSPHGMNVFSLIAANDPGKMIGTAPKASFYLFSTEDIASEYPIEEYNWVVAAEYADSIGVDMISSSLGYSIFTDPSLNHTINQLDGATAAISIGAGIASSKGIIVVSSAGNEGNKAWKKISFPADAKNIISVGAVDSTGLYQTWSSVGLSADKRIKPNVVSMGYNAIVQVPNGGYARGSGTSYSAPIIAGLTACLWQAFPDKSNLEIINAIEQSGNQFNAPDSLKGYGIPDYEKAYNILFNSLKPHFYNDSIYIYPNPFNEQITIDFNSLIDHFSVDIYSLTGTKIYTNTINNYYNSVYTIKNLTMLSKGLYIVKIVTPSKTFEYKMTRVRD